MTELDPGLLAAGVFAPAAVWLLWRGQTLSVELLRRALLLLARHRSSRWLYFTVSWFGTFLHEVSHATVLLLSGHGVRQFRAGAERGHVTPARMRKGALSFLSFLVAALAPLFVPPLLVLAALAWLDPALLGFQDGGPGLAAAWDLLRGFAVSFPQRLLLDLANLDLARPLHAGILALVLLGMPGARPSHVRKPGELPEGDVAVLRSRIREQPIPFLAFVALLYAASFLTLAWPALYWWPVQAVWALALTGITLALVGTLCWGLSGLSARSRWWAGWVGPAAFVAAEVALRPLVAQLWLLNLLSLALWLATALAAAVLLPRRS